MGEKSRQILLITPVRRMATDKNKNEGLSVESRLKSLYQLQTVLSEIDRIKTIRGELPLEVKDLEDSLAGLHTRISNYEQEIAELRNKLAQEKEKINDSQNKIARYKEQLENVRNNREFDLLSKEVEFQTLEIELSEKHLGEYTRQIEQKQNDIEATREKVTDHEHVLAEKRAELEEIVSETRQDEERLRQQAKDLEPQIDSYTLNAFKRIRKNARNGLGVVYIQRNACGGCFNRIPPQKQLEIKMRKKIIVCEYCGRILIDPDIAGVEAVAAKYSALIKIISQGGVSKCIFFDTPLLLYNTFGNGNFIVAPDLRDGRPPEEAEHKNVSCYLPRIWHFKFGAPLRVACRPGGPAPLPSGNTKVTMF